MVHLLEDIRYLVRGVSDHSPLLVLLVAKPAADLPKAPWKLNLFPSHERVLSEISGFWRRHEGHLRVDMGDI